MIVAVFQTIYVKKINEYPCHLLLKFTADNGPISSNSQRLTEIAFMVQLQTSSCTKFQTGKTIFENVTGEASSTELRC